MFFEDLLLVDIVFFNFLSLVVKFFILFNNFLKLDFGIVMIVLLVVCFDLG